MFRLKKRIKVAKVEYNGNKIYMFLENYQILEFDTETRVWTILTDPINPLIEQLK